MKQVLAIMGSGRKKGNGFTLVHEIEKELTKNGDVTVKYLYLSEKNLQYCKGCMVCYEKGETVCPIKDDALAIQDEMLAADGVIFYTPTYVMNVSGLMKTLIDRYSFVCHRPFYSGKKALLLTSVGGPGSFFALLSLLLAVSNWGFRIIGKFGFILGKKESNSRYWMRTQKILKRMARRFYRSLDEKVFRPNFVEIFGFRLRRYFFVTKEVEKTAISCKHDRQMWIENGWADKKTKFFCDGAVNPFVDFAAFAAVEVMKRVVS